MLCRFRITRSERRYAVGDFPGPSQPRCLLRIQFTRRTFPPSFTLVDEVGNATTLTPPYCCLYQIPFACAVHGFDGIHMGLFLFLLNAYRFFGQPFAVAPLGFLLPFFPV